VLFDVRTFDISIRLVSRPFSLPPSFSSFPAQFFAKHAARGLGAVIPEKREKCSRDNAARIASGFANGCERYPAAAFRQRFPRWPKMSRARARDDIARERAQ